MLATKLKLGPETESIKLGFPTKMANMDPTAAPAPSSDVQNTPSEVDVTKRDAANGVSNADEPPSKKARLDETSENTEQDLRSKGIAPIKAEYVCPVF